MVYNSHRNVRVDETREIRETRETKTYITVISQHQFRDKFVENFVPR
jgi:hypothetical protein